MAEQAELAFIKTYVNTISSQPVSYADDYQQPPENSLKRIPILTVAIPPPPEPKVEESAPSSSATLTLTIKSTKPPITYTLAGIHPTDSISAIKQHLSSSNPTAPPPDAQRLLLKGKALADNKLLKEYTVKDGDTINLMVKPGIEWDPQAAGTDTKSIPTLISPAPTPALSVSSPLLSSSSSDSISGGRSAGGGRGKHQRIPSVVLSPSPSNDDSEPRKDVLLTLDTNEIDPPSAKEPLSAYHSTISKPEFWDRLYSFLRTEFTEGTDALTAFEDFLAASKGSLTASDIAKIRDHVGVVGMAGT